MAGAEATLGRSIPAETPHAVSVSLPTWRANVGYEEGEEWVASKMTTGYPRFFINKKIVQLAQTVLRKLGCSTEQAMLFPSSAAANRCLDFIRHSTSSADSQTARIVDYVCPTSKSDTEFSSLLQFSAVVFPSSCFKAAKSFWQHSGEGISSRRAEFYQPLVDEGQMVPTEQDDEQSFRVKGPKRYRKPGTSTPNTNASTPSSEHPPNVLESTSNGVGEHNDHSRFVEERFGRNLDVSQAKNAKLAIQRRITGSLTTDRNLPEALAAPPDSARIRDSTLFIDDVYLYSCGMNSIYTTYRMILAAKGSRKSICFGFPYLDTLKVLEKFGPGCLFYGHGTSEELDDLERRLQNGERYTSLFCEFPSNPLLQSPDLLRIRTLADQYDFAVVIDETIGNFLNVHVLPYADVLVSSLTKIFSGDSNVMGGSAILNPRSTQYHILKPVWEAEYEDYYWPEDAIFMERNSRDFVSRIERINVNAEAICQLLEAHPRVKQVYYPKISPSRPYYDRCRTPNGGYGGLLSATFHSTEDATAFYDTLDTEKGPSLGTNFTLASPFVLIAHYTELEWAAQYGVEKNLIRFSVGLEDTADLQKNVARALAALPA